MTIQSAGAKGRKAREGRKLSTTAEGTRRPTRDEIAGRHREWAVARAIESYCRGVPGEWFSLFSCPVPAGYTETDLLRVGLSLAQRGILRERGVLHRYTRYGLLVGVPAVVETGTDAA